MESSPSGRERRRHPRYPVDLKAEIHLDQARSVPCAIRDICLGGVLICCRNDKQVAGLNVGEDCEIEIHLAMQTGSRVLRVPSKIVRLVGGGCGARFTRVSAVMKAAINAYIRKRCSLETAHGKLPEKPGPTESNTAKTILKRVLSNRIDGLISVLEEEFERELWDAGERAGNDFERTAITESIVLLAKARREMRLQQEMRKGLLGSLDRLERLSAGSDKIAITSAESGLELVDQQLFDMWLAKLLMVNRIEEDLAAPLRVLRGQAAAGMGEGQKLPIEPQILAELLDAGLKSIAMDNPAEATCFHAAARCLPRSLGPLYRELSAAWEAAGLKPVGVETHTQSLSRVRDPQAEPLAPVGSEASGTDSGESTRGLKPQGGPMHLPVPLSPARAAEVLASLPSDALEGDDWEHSGRSLKARVLDVLANAAPEIRDQRLERRLDERIGSSDRMLTNMLDDPLVSSEMKDWIKRFALKFLTAAVSKPDFFQDPAHPIKALIDQLERVYQFLPDGAGRGNLKARRETERLMEQALAVNIDEVDTVSGYTEQLAGIYRRYGGEYQRRVERVVAAYEGRAQVLDTEQRVREMLNRALAGQRVHRVVDELARGSWLLLLKLVLLREGEDSAEWQRYWNCLMQIHMICSGDDGERELRPVPATLRDDFQDGLSYIGFDPFRKSELSDRVEVAIESVRKGSRPNHDFRIFRPLPMVAGQDSNELDPADVDSSDWHRLLAQVDQLEIGSSLRLKDTGEQHRLRLVWKSRNGSELIFANPRGEQTRTLGRTDLAQAFNRGEASALPPEASGVSERATEATLREMQERIKYHETHDQLTGLNNLQHLRGALTTLLIGPRDGFHVHALGILELDHFEMVNGSCGYTAGEHMLAAVGRLLENTLEESTCMAYLGGSQFGMLVPASDEQQGNETATRVRRAMADMPFFWHGKSYPVTTSIGLMMVHADCENPETLLSAANAACSAARQAGGNRVLLYREDDESIVGRLEEMQWWGLTENTVKEERVRLRGQLIAPTRPAENSHQHYEILLSVYDENNEALPLNEFINSAEVFNIMADVDRLVIRKALSWVSENLSKIESLGGIAINLSGQSLVNSDMVDFIRDNIEGKGIPPAFVSFEVTETSAIASLDRAAAVIQGIKDLGCRFALDDFGTGMASYGYLKQLPVDFIKIDGAFVRNILDNVHDQAIVKSINEIAHFMGKETIAEYVENQEILEYLREIGIDYAQGFALEKPVFLDEIA